MRIILRFAVIIIFLSLPWITISGQEYRWEYKINGAYNIGGTSPLPLPVEIRKIEKFSPSAFSPHIALEALRWIDSRWGVVTQITLDYKGFTITDQVKSLHTEIEMGDDTYVGHFTGKNTTKIKNTYVTLPVLATYKINERWLMQLGPYVAYLYHPDFKGTASDGYIRQGSPIGEKTIVTDAFFDFSESQNRFDYGIVLGGEWAFHPDFSLRGQLSWGLKPLFPSDFTGVPFKMYNIYGSIGVSYRLNTK